MPADDAYYGIYGIPAGKRYDYARDDDSYRYQRVEDHVQICAADIQVALLARSEKPRRQVVDRNACGGRCGNAPTGYGLRIEKPLDALPDYADHGGEQQ